MGGGGGVYILIYKENNTFSFHIFFTFYAITFIERKQNSGEGGVCQQNLWC